VTDAGLKHLAALKELRILRLFDTHVTDSGVAALQKQLPEVDVKRSSPGIEEILQKLKNSK